VIAVDTNILVYAHREECALHSAALKELTTFAESPKAWAIPIFCISEFLRVITHPNLFDPPLGMDLALESLGRILESPSIEVLLPGENYLRLLSEVCLDSKVSGNLVFDAQIVALLKENAVNSILTEDRDFLRFKGLKVNHL
jgi:toxin-antitoxin system PIN domain toxin